MTNGDWDWGLGIGSNPQSPTLNPQYQSPFLLTLIV